jgi:hypothetical protein
MTFKTPKNRYLQIIILLFIFTSIFQFITPANHPITKNYNASDLEVRTDLKSFSNKDTSNSNQWTIMAIVNAEAIFGEHAALDCLQELEDGFKLGSGVEVVALVDRIPGYDSSNGNWTNSRYYHIVPDNDTRVISSELIQQFNELNLGNPNTYRNFVLWAQSTYPAEKYALTYIGHGGAVSGFSFDMSNADHITLDEFQQAMSGLYVDVVALDSCKMGTLELAYESRTFTDYIVFSEQFSVTEGLDYKAFIEELCNEPSMKPLELAELIVRTSLEWYTWKWDHTYSVINCSALTPFINELSKLSVELTNLLPQEIARIAGIRLSTYSFDHSYLDLGSFLNTLHCNFSNNILIQDLTQSLIDLYDDIVLFNYVDAYAQNATGLTIFYPQDSRSLTNIFDLSTYMNATKFLDFDSLDFLEDCLWDEFLYKYLLEAPFVEEKFVPIVDIELETSIDINISPENSSRKYKIDINTPTAYHFTLDVHEGDPRMFVEKYTSSGHPLGHLGYLFSDTQNPEQDISEDIVHWLEIGSYIIEILSWTPFANGTLFVKQEPIQNLTLDGTIKGDFPPRRAVTAPIKTIYNYYMISLDKGTYDLLLDISDHGLLHVKIWDQARSSLKKEFYGNEGEDFLYPSTIGDSEILLLEFACYEWTGSYTLSVTKSKTSISINYSFVAFIISLGIVSLMRKEK